MTRAVTVTVTCDRCQLEYPDDQAAHLALHLPGLNDAELDLCVPCLANVLTTPELVAGVDAVATREAIPTTDPTLSQASIAARGAPTPAPPVTP